MAIGSVARRVGIAGKDNVQWGEHLCAFFNTRIDLLNLVVPYIKAGLEDNEFCLWITDENMEQQAMVLRDPKLQQGSQLMVLNATERCVQKEGWRLVEQ